MTRSGELAVFVRFLAACVVALGICAALAPCGTALAVEANVAKAPAGTAAGAERLAGEAGATALSVQARAENYGVYVGGKAVTPANSQDVMGDGGSVSYDAATNTLTLNNARISAGRVWKSADGKLIAGICSSTDKPLTMNLVGKSTLSVPNKANRDISYGILAATDHSGKLVVTGDGALTVKAGKAKRWSMGIFATTVSVQGKAKLVVRAGKAACGSYGLYLRSKITLKGTTRVASFGRTAAFNRAPRFAASYEPDVRAGSSAKAVTTVCKARPKARVYTKNRYVSITNVKAQEGEGGNSQPSGPGSGDPATDQPSGPGSDQPSMQEPGAVQMTSLEAVLGGFKAGWTTLGDNCTGYELQASLDAGFENAGAVATYITPGSDVNGAIVMSLSLNATYFVRVRALNADLASTLYGPWSEPLSITFGASPQAAS